RLDLLSSVAEALKDRHELDVAPSCFGVQDLEIGEGQLGSGAREERSLDVQAVQIDLHRGEMANAVDERAQGRDLSAADVVRNSAPLERRIVDHVDARNPAAR